MTSAASISRRPRPGRPRHIPERSPLTPRAEIIDTAARLFTEQSFGATSTRDIAEAIGIRQASLYYHFAGKDEILTEVLARTIRPTLESIDLVEELTDDSGTALYLLALLDVHILASAPHNSGLLGLLPDVAKKAPGFGVERRELGAEYGRLGALVAPAHITASDCRLGLRLLETVEGVAGWLGDGSYREGRSGDVIASSVLRICGADDIWIEEARAAAHELLPEVTQVGNDLGSSTTGAGAVSPKQSQRKVSA